MRATSARASPTPSHPLRLRPDSCSVGSRHCRCRTDPCIEDDSMEAEVGNAFGRRHVLRDLGWAVFRDGDNQHGAATVSPEMHVPGTSHLRTSILVTWADVLAGYLAMDVFSPRVPVTLELDVHL